MALTGDEIETVTRNLVDLYRQAELRIVAEVTRRLAAGQDAPDWAVQRLAALASLRRANEQILAAVEQEAADSIRETIAEAYRTGTARATTGLPADLWPRDPDMVAARAATDLIPRAAAMESLAAAWVADVGAKHSNVLRHVSDVYRSVIQQAVAVSIAGGMSRRDASQWAYARFVDQGVTSFVDTSGRRWRLSSYVEMSTRTVTQRAAIQGTTDRLESIGVDLVAVSDSPRECPLCRPFEGKVLSLGAGPTGRIEVLSAISDEMVTVDVAGTLGQARGLGLFHPNCTHSVRAYLPGVTRLPAPGTTANPQGYAAKDRQRAVERNIRRWKERELAALTPEAKAAAAAKVRHWQKNLRGHLAANPQLKRLRYREQIGAGNLPPTASPLRRTDIGDSGPSDQPPLPRRQRRQPPQQSSVPAHERLTAATTIQEVEQALISGWRAITGSEMGADLAGGDLESVREAAATLLTLAGRWPQAQLRHIEIFKLDEPREAARTQGVSGIGSSITLNQSFFAGGNRPRLLAVLDRAVENGFLVGPADVRALITHEFGHVLDIQSRPGWSVQLDAEILSYAAARGVAADGLSEFISRELSRYAASHVLEAVAEAFTEVVLAPPGRPFARLIYDRLMDALG